PKNANTRPTTMSTPAIAQMRVGGRKSRNAMRWMESFCWEYKNPSKENPLTGLNVLHLHIGRNIFMDPRSFSAHGRKYEAIDGGGAEDGRDVVDRGIRVRDRPDVEHRG